MTDYCGKEAGKCPLMQNIHVNIVNIIDLGNILTITSDVQYMSIMK